MVGHRIWEEVHHPWEGVGGAPGTPPVLTWELLPMNKAGSSMVPGFLSHHVISLQLCFCCAPPTTI